MDKEVLEHLFEPFFTTKDLGRGTGLGLATVYGIVKQNDGYINVYSERSKGATFKIYLRRFEVDHKSVQEETADEEHPQKGTETILLVEDDPILLNLSKTILEFLGYTVILTERPEEAVRLVEEHVGDIHLLITDVVMPGMNGHELAERLQVIRPKLKCLYMSGYTANVIAHRGILEEGVQFISKPFRMNDLAKAVRTALSGRAAV
jgi:CheY-like chemotaxis protein